MELVKKIWQKQKNNNFRNFRKSLKLFHRIFRTFLLNKTANLGLILSGAVLTPEKMWLKLLKKL